MNKIDINKKYRTEDGQEVMLFTTTSPIHNYPITGATKERDGRWVSRGWAEDGNHTFGEKTGWSLIEVREPREWTLAVATNQNPIHPTGYISWARTRDGEFKGFWEAVKVREVIE